MSTPETHPTQRVARPTPDDERGWLGLVLHLLPVPTVLVDPTTGRVVLNNPAAARVSLAESLAPDLTRLAAEAVGDSGAPVAWSASSREHHFRAFARPLPPADGVAPLVLLTFLEEPHPETVEKELRDALQVRDEFFSVATHELKDPLFSIQLSLQLLRRAAEKHGPTPVHVAHHLDVSERQVNRLSRLIDNLLDVSRIQSGRMRLDPEALDLSALAREAASRFQESARAAGVALGTEAAGEVIGYFDRLKIDQVISNILTNAIKYGAGKPVTLRVRAEGETAILEVEDRGLGIAPADQERIFARFERVSDGHKKESLGLGLYIVRSIALAHGGSVSVRSAPGRGATFTVTLPRYRLYHKGEEANDPGARPEGNP